MATLSIKVPKRLKARLAAVAKARKTKPAALARKTHKPVSAYDAVKHLLSRCGASPQGDLSTDKRHLNGLGK